MTLYELRSDVKLLAEMLKLSKDSRLRDPHIDFMIRKHRARGIREEYARNLFIDPAWLQDFGRVAVTPVNSADDPAIPYTSKSLGKFTLPSIVSLPLDKGVYRIAHTSKFSEYYYITQSRFFSLVEGSITSKFDYWFRVGVSHFISPCATEVNPVVILDNPLDGYVLLTENVGQSDLEIGQNYTVYGTQIIHNSVAYNPTSTFTAVNRTYSGNGYVRFTTQKRKMTDRDPYPMSLTLAEFILMKIFTEDFLFSRQSVADILNDAQSQIAIMQNPNAEAKLNSQKEGA